MQLRYISLPSLVNEAGGNPWAVNRSLQRGQPAHISLLGKAFHDAGQLTGEAETAFSEALRRFEAAWNHEAGGHPINDAAEVQRATGALGVQAAQLPQIAIDLERVAAVLAEAQRAAAGQIQVLERQLEAVDSDLGQAHTLLDSHQLSMAYETALDDILGDLEQDAINKTAAALRQVEQIREMYSELLNRLMTRMRVQGGYDGAGIALDGLWSNSPASSRQAERDVHSALAGDKSAASRVNSVLNSITADQRAGKAPLTPDQASVLSQLQAQQHGMSIEELSTAEQRLGDQRDMVANSWQLMSNPALTFPRTDLEPGALQGIYMVNGSEAQLPESVMQALTAPWSQYYDLVVGQLLAAGDPMKAVTDIVRHGRPSFQTNTGLDRQMLARASAMMDATFGESVTPAQARLGALAFDPLVANIFAAVSPDHQVVHDRLTGESGPVFLDHVARHFWGDHGKGAATLFDWTEHAARGPEAGIAGQAARALSMYIGANEAPLLHLPGDHTVGEVNPDLVRGMAHGLAPYVNNIAGTGGLAEFGEAPDGSREGGVMPLAKGIFSVLSTDEASAQYFDGAADREAIIAEGAYAQEVAKHEPGTGMHNANLHHAMTLRGLVNSGLHNALQADTENKHLTDEAAATAEYTRRKLAYELAAKALSSAAGFVPTVGSVSSAVLGFLGTAIENDYVGPAPSGVTLTDHALPNMSIGQADREILNAVIASGQRVEGIPPQYMVEGRIGTPDELARGHVQVDLGEYEQTLNRLLTAELRQGQGAVPAQPFVPDLYMVDRYNAVVKDPNPQKR